MNELVPLRYLTSVLSRGTAPNYVDDGPVRMISQAANQSIGLDWNKTRFHEFSGNPRSLRGYLQEGDVLVNSTGTGTLGRIGWFETGPDSRPCVADGHVTTVRFDPARMNQRFGYYFLCSNAFQDLMFETLVSGSTNQIELNGDRMRRVSAPNPPIEEQRRIADFLDAETSRLDLLTNKATKSVGLLDERIDALTEHLVLGGTRRERELRPSGICALEKIPSSWKVMRNKNLLREVVDLSVDGSEELLTVSHITGVTPRSQKDVYMFLAESHVGYKRCKPGDLVLNTMWVWMGALGVSRYSGIVSPAYGVYRPTLSNFVADYFDLLYRSSAYVCEMTRFSKGVWSSRLRLYPESFLSLNVPVPPVDEQKEIVSLVRRESGPLRYMQSQLRSFIQLLAERRQALITAAVTGQLDVTTVRSGVR